MSARKISVELTKAEAESLVLAAKNSLLDLSDGREIAVLEGCRSGRQCGRSPWWPGLTRSDG